MRSYILSTQTLLHVVNARTDDLETLRVRTTMLTTGWRSEEEVLSPRSQTLDIVMQFRVGVSAAPSPFLNFLPT